MFFLLIKKLQVSPANLLFSFSFKKVHVKYVFNLYICALFVLIFDLNKFKSKSNASFFHFFPPSILL
jgi:hypothetical protein